jgi:hypothetical protein
MSLPKRSLTNSVGHEMSKAIYKIVRHDGRWAYESNGAVSEHFGTREQARAAARLTAREQCLQRAQIPISHEHRTVERQEEIPENDHRLHAEVKG